MVNNVIDSLDKCHFHFDSSWKYIDEVIEANKLLSFNRFDLNAILLYIDQKVKGVKDLSFAKDIYYQRTNIITGFSCSEKGNENKNSFEDFIDCLDKLIDDFSNERYDAQRSPVPVDCNYVIMDGAHRVCCAAYFNTPVRIVRFIDKDFKQHVTSEFLRKNALPEYAADAMALEYCKWHANTFMLFLWPKAFVNESKREEAVKVISESVNIVYQKESVLTYEAVRNLMIQIYSHMDWVGNVDNDFYNTYVKADEVWDKNGQVQYLLVEGTDTQAILELKKRVRNIFGIGLASIHSTDNATETLIAANLIFNKNSMHHLIYGHPTKYPQSHHLVEKFKKEIIERGYDSEKFVVDSSMVLAIYGIREAGDLDFYSLYDDVKLSEQDCEAHDDFLKFHKKSKMDLIVNPSNYFIYNGVKFISLECLANYKRNRNYAKDINDLKLIKAYCESGNQWKMFIFRLNDTIKRKNIIYKRKIRKSIRSILISINIFDSIYLIYKKIK